MSSKVWPVAGPGEPTETVARRCLDGVLISGITGWRFSASRLSIVRSGVVYMDVT